MVTNKSLYTIHDCIAKESGNVFTAKNDEVALRQVKNTFVENQYMNITEYKLYRLGFYNPETSEILPAKEEIDLRSIYPVAMVQDKLHKRKFEYPPDPALYKGDKNAK